MNDLESLPPYIYGRECADNERVWTEAAVRAAVAAERERCAKLCDEVRAAIWDYHDKQVRDTAETVCINLAVRIREA